MTIINRFDLSGSLRIGGTYIYIPLSQENQNHGETRHRKESIERDAAVILILLTFCHSAYMYVYHSVTLPFCDSVPCPVNIAREMEALPGLGLGGSEASM